MQLASLDGPLSTQQALQAGLPPRLWFQGRLAEEASDRKQASHVRSPLEVLYEHSPAWHRPFRRPGANKHAC